MKVCLWTFDVEISIYNLWMKRVIWKMNCSCPNKEMWKLPETLFTIKIKNILNFWEISILCLQLFQTFMKTAKIFFSLHKNFLIYQSLWNVLFCLILKAFIKSTDKNFSLKNLFCFLGFSSKTHFFFCMLDKSFKSSYRRSVK